jgi:hypothetical protein
LGGERVKRDNKERKKREKAGSSNWNWGEKE